MSARIVIERDGEKVTVDRSIKVSVGDKVLIEDWEWESLTFPEAIAIEAASGTTTRDFRVAVTNGSMTALQILLWTILKRENPGLRLAEVNMPIGDVHTEVVDTDVPAAEELGPTSAAADAQD